MDTTTNTATTTAQKIAAMFGNDGQCWDTAEGVEPPHTFDSACQEHRAAYASTGFDKYRYTFADGSVLTVAGDAWDFGYADCYCWEGNGHAGTDCPLSPDYEADD